MELKKTRTTTTYQGQNGIYNMQANAHVTTDGEQPVSIENGQVRRADNGTLLCTFNKLETTASYNFQEQANDRNARTAIMEAVEDFIEEIEKTAAGNND